MRPYVIINSAMSIDGKIASVSMDSRLSSMQDIARVHRLRSMVDAVMVGINTVKIDDPMLNVRYVKGKKRSPLRVIVDSNATIADMNCKIMDTCNTIPTLIAVSERASKDRINTIISKGAKVIIIGKDMVDLKGLLHELASMNIKSVLVEGGGEVNWSLIKEGLLDELIVTVAPVILGGRDAKTLVEGEGFGSIKDALRLSLVRVKKDRRSGEVILHYKRFMI
jgi:2,5-diamino-6-(ribosylamino)-4(3H)-pyrimidinone 5'-phosphate reductase